MTKPDEIVIVATHQLNPFGDLEFTDTAGGKHRIGKKREKLFPFIQDGTTVKLIYDTYMNKDYIANLGVVGVSEVQKPIEKPVVTPVVKQEATQTTKPVVEVYAPQLVGLFWKEMGECLRKDGYFTEPVQIMLKRIYCAKMYEVLGIKLEDIKPK